MEDYRLYCYPDSLIKRSPDATNWREPSIVDGHLQCRALCSGGHCGDTLPLRLDMDDSPPLCPLNAYIEGNFRFPSGSASTRIADLLEVMESLERVGRAPSMPNVLSLFGGARVVYPKQN